MRRLNRTLAKAARGATARATGAEGTIGVGFVTGGVWQLAGIGWAAIVFGAFFLLAAAVRR